MTQQCSRCSRANPADASYCYFDGAALAGNRAQSGPVQAGSQPFPSQFVFPSGQACRNFDELALACQNNWKAAVDLLKQGFLSGFLGGLGRADLALAAQEAARFPDQDRGLDQLLAKLPSQALAAPKLKVEPTEINLGQLPMGTDRTIELHISNQGMRLLYGSVDSDSKWLTLGDPPGSPQKLFQAGTETVIPVHVRGQHLRAGTKPLEGKLVVESSGGSATIVIRADVPIAPFSEGVLAGALTPRQIAEKAKAQPQAAAPLFEKGNVAQWFTKNGWTYPVQGPSASGLGAVQQFFEALGLAKAPKVEIATKALTLKGAPGQALQATIEVSTPEKKPVYAHATADQTWLDVSKVKLAGRSATITVIATVPSQPGQTLQATINVQGNGNQRFQVPLTLTVEGELPVADLTLALVPGAPLEPLPAPTVASGPLAPVPVDAGNPFAFAAPAPLPVEPAAAFADLGAAAAAPPLAPARGAAPAAPAAATTKAPRAATPMWMHLVPLALLGVALLVVMLRDLIGKPATGGTSALEDDIDRTRRLGLFFDYDPKGKDKNIGSLNFGLVMVDPKDPHAANPKKLTFDHKGATNSTVLRIDGKAERHIGTVRAGKWLGPPENFGKYDGKKAEFVVSPEPIHVIQKIEIVPGEPVEVVTGVYKRLLDMCLVRYVIENKGTRTYKVGIRCSIDTFIGSNDGVPFTIPGKKELVDKAQDFTGKDVPDFIEALEKPNLNDPGTVARLNIHLGSKSIEPPSRVSLTLYPGTPDANSQDKWEVPVITVPQELEKDPKKKKPLPKALKFTDSAIVMYWPEKDLPKGESREVGFSYGLGNVVTGGGMLLTVGGSFTLGGELTVVALVGKPGPKQTVTLEYPADKFTLIDGSVATQSVPEGKKGDDGKIPPSPITWRLRANADGNFTIGVKSSDGLTQQRRITIQRTTIF